MEAPGIERLFKPTIGQAELDRVGEAFGREWLGLGPAVSQFEEVWSLRLGTSSTVAVNSCTAALHLAVDAAHLPKESKVLVPALTFASTALAPMFEGLVPVMVDSDPSSLTVSVQTLNDKYTPEVSAVIVTHYAGHPAPMVQIMEWASARDVVVIEDCAHTIGTLYENKPLGLWGDFGCFSFEEKKIMTTGDGGLVVSSHEDKLDEIRTKRWLGIDRMSWRTDPTVTVDTTVNEHWYYEVSLRGFKYNMNDLAASVGLAQLAQLDEMLAQRRKLVARYCENLQEIDGAEPMVPYVPDVYDYQMFGVRVDERDKIMGHLKERGVATGSHYTPLSIQPLFRQNKGSCPFIEKEADRLLTLPLHLGLTLDSVDAISEALAEGVRS